MITQRKKLAVCFGLSLGLVLIPAQTIFADETAEQISVVSVATQMVQSANSLTDSGNTKLAFTNKIMVNVEAVSYTHLYFRYLPAENIPMKPASAHRRSQAGLLPLIHN